jgi:hypothetical protein
MRYGLGQNGAAVQDATPRLAPNASTVKEIPYDYVATFKLKGERTNRVLDVITISTEGTFVAVSVGYSFFPAENALSVPGAVPAPLTTVFGAAFATQPTDAFRSFLEGCLVRWPGIHFLYSIVDSGSGRELQNKQVQSLAGFGASDGHRPFRPFARPVPFVPRSTIRIEVQELSDGPFFKDGELQIVLHGYKRLGE